MSVAIAVLLGATGSILGSLAITLGTNGWHRSAARRRWRLRAPSTLRVVAAASEPQRTGTYSRPTTGKGQADAWSEIKPHIETAYPGVEMDWRFCLSDERGLDLRRDLVLLGGPKTNEKTQMILDELAKQGSGLDVTQQRSTIRTADGRTFVGDVNENEEVVKDCGLIIRTRNPFDKSRSVVILSGCHTHGTAAAARHFVHGNLPRGDFAMVVECQFHDNRPLVIKEKWRSQST